MAITASLSLNCILTGNKVLSISPLAGEKMNVENFFTGSLCRETLDLYIKSLEKGTTEVVFTAI